VLACSLVNQPSVSRPRPKVHPPEWTPEQVSAFWDNYGSIPHFRTRMFSLAWGYGILEFAERFIPRQGVVLDYGCGRGDLMEAMLASGRTCMGCDSSPDSLRTVDQRFAGNERFLGTFQTPPRLPQTPDVITLVEVIEHLPPAAAREFLGSVAALLKPGGHIVITCPNKEDLQASEVLCPECGCCFHAVQHLQSLAPTDVAALAQSAGFRSVFAGATRFRKNSESGLYRALLAGWYGLFGKPPHLVYVGQKT
jgi:SAM-dependent methyltransferase